MHNGFATFSPGTTIAWLALANPVGVAQALWNRDPFWGIESLAEPPRGWVKESPQLKG
jgi:hypothetical protein